MLQPGAACRAIWPLAAHGDGGAALVAENRKIVDASVRGPHIFNLGHGITPDADPENVQLMIDTVRSM